MRAIENPGKRKISPVFVMGCHRSGTNLLYDMLLSAGGFANYRGSLPVYETLIPRFGSLDHRGNRKKLLETWLRSKGFRRTGLDANQLSLRILNECRDGGDFIRVVMDAVAHSQGVPRWAAYDPDNVLHVDQLKASIPNALFLHIIRDGRDIALSLKKMGGFSPLPWDRSATSSLVATALYWEWMVRSGRDQGSRFPADYLEIHYEDLINQPREILQKLSGFLDHDLDYDRIQRVGLGRLSESNSSFREEIGEEQINPSGRWRERLSPTDVAAIEAAVGKCLEQTGYALSLPEAERTPGMRQWGNRALYRTYLNTKMWVKMNTPAGRMANLSVLELEDGPDAIAQSVQG
ncbi:MAG: sulfotransferase family protein [Terriglobales bacterium]